MIQSRPINLRPLRPARIAQRSHAVRKQLSVLQPRLGFCSANFNRQSVKRYSAPSSSIQSVSAAELEVAVQTRDRPLIIDFYADWCGPCVMLSKELETVSKQLGDKVRILKVDVEQNQQISNDLQIQGLPTVIFINTAPEKPALRVEGFLPADKLIEVIQTELLAPPPAPPPSELPEMPPPPQ